MGQPVNVGDGLGRQVIEKLRVVAGERGTVELLEGNLTELWDEVIAQAPLLDLEGGLCEPAEPDARVRPRL